jgi:tryptophan 2,3-dioxygenase
LDALLSLQQPESAKTGKEAHEEHLFIVMHQTYELWFKQILHELDSITDLFSRATLPERFLAIVVNRLERVTSILKILVEQITILETMDPLDFLEFREGLSPASGFQSVQFRVLENKLGMLQESRIQYQVHLYSFSLISHSLTLSLLTFLAFSLSRHHSLTFTLSRYPLTLTRSPLSSSLTHSTHFPLLHHSSLPYYSTTHSHSLSYSTPLLHSLLLHSPLITHDTHPSSLSPLTLTSSHTSSHTLPIPFFLHCFLSSHSFTLLHSKHTITHSLPSDTESIWKTRRIPTRCCHLSSDGSNACPSFNSTILISGKATRLLLKKYIFTFVVPSLYSTRL